MCLGKFTYLFILDGNSNLISRFNSKVNDLCCFSCFLYFQLSSIVKCLMFNPVVVYLKKMELWHFRGCVNDEFIVLFLLLKSPSKHKAVCFERRSFQFFKFPCLFFVLFQSSWVTTFKNINKRTSITFSFELFLSSLLFTLMFLKVFDFKIWRHHFFSFFIYPIVPLYIKKNFKA